MDAILCQLRIRLATNGLAGDVGPLCRAVSDAVFDQSTTPQVFLSLCPTATEARDLWKEPLALVLGVAQRLPQHLFLGLRDLQTVLRSLWESAGKRLSVPFTPENLAETGCNSSVISVLRLQAMCAFFFSNVCVCVCVSHSVWVWGCKGACFRMLRQMEECSGKLGFGPCV